MDLSPTTTTFAPVDEKAWLGSKHGTDCPFSITIDVASVAAAAIVTDVASGRKHIKSGVALQKLGSDLYGTCGAADVADVHLFEAVEIKATSTTVAGSALWHGVVIEAKVPAPFVAANKVPANVLYR